MLGQSFKGREGLGHRWGWARHYDRYHCDKSARESQIQGWETGMALSHLEIHPPELSSVPSLCESRRDCIAVKGKGSTQEFNYAPKTRSQPLFPPLLWLLSYL